MVDWDDGTSTEWLGPFSYNENPSFNHSWSKSGTYNVTFKSKDDERYKGLISDSSIYVVTITSIPKTPQQPQGPSTGKNENTYEYYTSCVEPDNDQVFYLWNWGDGSNSGWIGTYNSEEVCYMSHSWDEEGEYEIKVKAKDEHGKESDWSDPLEVTMPKNKAIDSFFLIFLENHPRMFPILKHLLEL